MKNGQRIQILGGDPFAAFVGSFFSNLTQNQSNLHNLHASLSPHKIA
jgi:hypothetical protein